MIESFVPATESSSNESFSVPISGFRVYLPSVKPTLAAPIGPWNGMPEIANAADAPISAITSLSFSPSCSITVQIT